jgi:DNA repair exonuclease SbcCD ATPase subunit
VEDELEVDPQTLAMQQVIGVLTPLRQHRQASAERAQRQAQKTLEHLHEHLQQTRDSYAQERNNQRERRQALSSAHVNKAMSLNDLDRWHEKENRMLDRLAYIRQDMARQALAIDAQTQRLDQARQTAKASQRAVEKLACLAEAIHEQGETP